MRYRKISEHRVDPPDHSFLNADEVKYLDQLQAQWGKCREYVRAAFRELIDE